MRSQIAKLAVWVLVAIRTAAAGDELTLVVRAGQHERRNTPVTVVLPHPGDLARANAAAVISADGTALAGQITALGLRNDQSADPRTARELHFVLPHLAAGASTTFRLRPATEQGATGASFRWIERPGQFYELRFGDRPVLRYMCAPYDDSTPQKREATYKVFHHVFSPAGDRLLTKGPGGKYTHHRGLFYGFRKTTYGEGKQCDIWHCKGGTHQSHEGVLSSVAGPVIGRHRVAIDWHGNDKEVFAHEERELTAWSLPGGTLTQFASRLRPADGAVQLDGDPQHAGFHFRADNEVAAKTFKQTYYLRTDGAGKPRETRNWSAKSGGPVNLPWNAMSFVLGDQRYTAAYLDHPDNPKEARYSERDYGRFGSYFVHRIEPGDKLDVRYRVWVQEGPMTVDQVQRLSDDFVEPVEVAVE